MDVIKRFGLMICILMILMAYLKQAIPRSKTMVLMKTIVSIFILISIIDGVRSIDFERLKEIFDRPYSVVTEKTMKEMEQGYKKEMNSFFSSQNVKAEVVELRVNDSAAIEWILISGADREMGKKLISARYQVNEEYIEVKDE